MAAIFEWELKIFLSIVVSRTIKYLGKISQILCSINILKPNSQKKLRKSYMNLSIKYSIHELEDQSRKYVSSQIHG